MRGIYYDLTESEYIYKLKDYKFYFSSSLYMNKFINGVNNYVKIEKLKMKQRLKVDFDITEILCISYYKKIEKRGFYITYKGKRIHLKNFLPVNKNINEG